MPMTLLPAPLTVGEAIERLAGACTPAEAAELIADKPIGEGVPVTAQAALHHGLMRHLRNEWGMHDRASPLSRSAKFEYGVEHGDDISGLIQNGFLGRIKGEPADLHALAARYREHWRRSRTATATPVPMWKFHLKRAFSGLGLRMRWPAPANA